MRSLRVIGVILNACYETNRQENNVGQYTHVLVEKVIRNGQVQYPSFNFSDLRHEG